MTKLTRRDFLKLVSRFLTVTGLAAVFGPMIAYFYPSKLEEQPSDPVRVGALDELRPGGSIKVPFGRYPALVINTSEGLRAYSAVCTHFACICSWEPELGQIMCPCHEGYFDPLDGHVISGPPPAPLESLQVQVVDNEIYIGGEA
jgi:Rieske Fe-S protein